MAEFITFKRWSLKEPDQEAALLALVQEKILPHYQKLPGCRKLGLLRVAGTTSYLATQHWHSKAAWKAALAAPAYAQWQAAYEPTIARWLELMTFEEEWETEELLGD